MDNNFKNNLKVKTPTVNKTQSSNFDNNQILSELGLLNLPKELQVSISNDKKYINIGIAGNKYASTHHLTFQLPLHENPLSYLKNHPDYQDLLNRYQLYTKE